MNRKIRTILVAIVANLFLIGIKFFLARISSSIALGASAWHSLSDLFPSAVVLFGLILTRGDGNSASPKVVKIENGIAMVVSGFIFFVGIEIIREAFAREARELENIALVTVISLASIAITYFMAQYQIFVGKEAESPALVANGIHARADMYSSIAVMCALVGALMGFSALDKIAALLIALLIMMNGLEVLSGAIEGLRRGGLLHLGHDDLSLENLIRKKALRYLPIGMIFAILAYASSGIFTVRWDEVAIVKRFGKPVRQVSSGLHYRLPWPFESQDSVTTSEVRMERVPNSLMVTGDSNLIEIEAVAHYQVSDPFAFLYKVSDPQNLVSDAALSALRGYINRNPVDFLITEGKDLIQTEALASAQAQLDAQGTGIKLLALQVTRDTPPADVLEAFRDVASAREDRSTYINEALAYQAELLPKTRGDAQKAIEEASAYREQKIRMSSGEAARFLAKAKAYRSNPGVTEKRMYIETMEKNLVSIEKLIVDKRVKVDTTDLWLTNGNQISVKKEAGNDE